MTIRSPCLQCAHGEMDKGARRCTECDLRVEYVRSLGDLIGPSLYSIPIRKEKRPMENVVKPETAPTTTPTNTEGNQFTCRKCLKQLAMEEMSSHRNICRECRNAELRAYRRRKAEERERQEEREDRAIARVAANIRAGNQGGAASEDREEAEGRTDAPGVDGPLDMRMTWDEELFHGYEMLRDKLLQDAEDNFRDPRRQVLWVLYQYYLHLASTED